MAETLVIDKNAPKEARYQSLLPQLEALVSGEKHTVSMLANVTAALKEAFGFFWVGFYLVEAGELVLGPFQGPIACSTIGFGKGVCGQAWQRAETIVVDDVNTFPGHIACSNASQSEIVVPVFDGAGKVAMVLDIDSDSIGHFDQCDRVYLEKLGAMVSKFLSKA